MNHYCNQLLILITSNYSQGIQVYSEAKLGGLYGFFKNTSLDRIPPEKHKTYAFQANRAKNRNQDIPLHDATRVRLKIEKETDNNYINASTVSCLPCERKWIVAQHPMEQYYEDFWKMVFYEEVDVIFAIFSPNEALPTYFPTETGKFCNHGDFFVHCWKMTPATGRNQTTSYTIEVLPHGCSNARYTTILHYPHWPKDQVAPSAKVILKGIQSLQPADNITKGRCLVHSSDGLNRSMCFVMVDFIVELMFRNNTVDVSILFTWMIILYFFQIHELVLLLCGQRGGAFNNRIFCVYALYVAIDYVKIRLTKFKNDPELLSEIENLQTAMRQEFFHITPKEPNHHKMKSVTDATE